MGASESNQKASVSEVFSLLKWRCSSLVILKFKKMKYSQHNLYLLILKKTEKKSNYWPDNRMSNQFKKIVKNLNSFQEVKKEIATNLKYFQEVKKKVAKNLNSFQEVKKKAAKNLNSL